MKKAHIKTPGEIKIMAEGGKRLAEVRRTLFEAIKEGISAMEIEELAVKEIKSKGGRPSFMMVPGYSWATCINVNSGLVHGIPKKEMVFLKGDIVSVDVGMYYDGFHTDTSVSKLIGEDKDKSKFLDAGKKALDAGIKQAVSGNKIKNISAAIENTFLSNSLTPVRALVGHGIGRSLHEQPSVPCFVSGAPDERFDIVVGLVLAIEVMYALGGHEVILDGDGWTIGMKDGKISALFEETVAVQKDGPKVLTT